MCGGYAMPRVEPSQRPGMGAVLYDGGTTFRVWAPHADQVYISGSFNQEAWREAPLASEGNGMWSADVEGAKADDQYEYVIVIGEQELHRIDPRAQHVTNSVGKGIIYDPAFDWAAHAQRIGVIFDVVYNHLGPSDLDLWQFDGWSQDGAGGIYFYEDWRSST